MIRIAGLSFGFGASFAVCRRISEKGGGEGVQTAGSALVFERLPSIDDYHRLVRQPGVEFSILPPCSPYSHFGAALWSAGVPCLAIENPTVLEPGASVFADFEAGTLTVAESFEDASNLRALPRALTQPSKPERDLAPGRIRVLAEIGSAQDIRTAMDDGASGLGVIRAEQLFREDGSDTDCVEGIIREVALRPQLLPLLVRFFDSPQLAGRRSHDIPQGYLAYRGVRILEVDDVWPSVFRSGLDALGLREVITVLPMVTTSGEIRQARRVIGGECRIGVTVETPAAAIQSAGLLDSVDFVQIGLNDLTQYTMAWDRDLPHPERMPVDRIGDAVARLISEVVVNCHERRIPNTLGLDLRPSLSLAKQIVSLGVGSISCAPALVRHWNQVLAAV